MDINRRDLINLAIKYSGDYKSIYNALKNDERVKDLSYDKDIKALTILDIDYPEVFLDLALPPLVLFYKGNLNLLKEDKVAVVGSRVVGSYAKRATIDIVNKLKNDYCIVSGLAKGVDSLAHISALSHSTIGVIGCGIDYIYPKVNYELYQKMIDKHLIISEYPFMTLPLASHFPFRNRLIAALARKVYVMQAGLKSGTFITVNEALELGREVYALPYSIYDSDGVGCNRLIEEGARLISLDD